MLNKLRNLEREMKTNQDRFEQEQRGLGSIPLLERKLHEMQDSESRLMDELNQAWNEKDWKVHEYQEQIEKERETSKRKIQELESKFKESEFAKNAQVFEIEKEKAKFYFEWERLNSAIEELKGQCDNYEKENRKVRAELDKLKKVKQTAQQKFNMFSGQAQALNTSALSGQVSTSAFRENKLTGKGSDVSYVPTSKKLNQSPRFTNNYLQESNKSAEKKSASKPSVNHSLISLRSSQYFKLAKKF